MPINSRNKGAAGEREWSNYVTERLAPTRRTQQYCGTAGDSDCVTDGLPVHWEIKRVEKLNLDKAMQQAIDEATEGSVPIVAHRKNKKVWLCTLRADDLLPLLKQLMG